ncbi:MAG TPA: hypothetical protein VNE63_07700, partial [Candidatus Acidoferrales bacterium]|nr:hypothetical protein [Candidatus Acidoferrales bacterium]
MTVFKKPSGAVDVLCAGSFYGRRLRIAEVGGFRIRETTYLRGLRTPWHRHGSPYLTFTIQGASLQRYAGDTLQTLQCRAGTLVFHSPDEIHQDVFLVPEVRVLQIEIESSRLGILGQSLCLLPTSKNLGQPIAAYLASRLYGELLQMDELSAVGIEGLMLELLASLLRVTIHPSERKVPPWLCRVEELIRHRSTEPWRLSAIAEEIGVHPVHLAR